MNEDQKQIKECIGFFGKQGTAEIYKVPIEDIDIISDEDELPVESEDRSNESRNERNVKDNKQSDDKSPIKRQINSNESGEKRSNDNKNENQTKEETKDVKFVEIIREQKPTCRLYPKSSPKVIKTYDEIIISDDDEPMDVNTKPDDNSAKASGSKDKEAKVTATDNIINEDVIMGCDEPSTSFNQIDSTDNDQTDQINDSQEFEQENNQVNLNLKSGNFILNSFKTLLKAKKFYMDTDHLVSVISCTLICTADDIFLYTHHSSYFDERAIPKHSMNIKMILSCTSSGIKFKPLFLLNHINLPRPLPHKNKLVHLLDKKKWIDDVFQQEIEKNMIHNCICLTENADFFTDGEIREKFEQLNAEIIVIPNSIAQNLSPFQHSIFLTLNGYLHMSYVKNKRIPNTLNTSLKAFEEAWDQLSENEIENAFEKLNSCLAN